MPATPKSAIKRSGAPKTKGAVRAKSGCYTCRIRRKKCDENQDNKGRCDTCTRLRLECLGFGAKRPDWLRENHNVIELREKIKKFLAAQGMIKGHSTSSSRNQESETPMLRLANDGYSSSSSSSVDSPPSGTLSLLSDSSGHIHGLTSSIRDSSPWPTSQVQSYTHGGLSPGQQLSPDEPYTSPRANAYPGDFMLAIYHPPTPHCSPSDTLVHSWPYNQHAQPLSFPSRASNSALSPSYMTMSNLYLGDSDDYITDSSAIPLSNPLELNAFQDGLIVEDLVRHYMAKVVELQYLLADKQSISGLIYETICSSQFARDTVCMLACVHRHSLSSGSAGIEEIEERYQNLPLIWPETSTAEDAMGALQLVSSFLFLGGVGEWQKWLSLSCHFSQRVLTDPRYGGQQNALLRCDDKTRFIIKTSMWFDVLASATLGTPPFFMMYFRKYFCPFGAHIEGPLSSPDPKLSLMDIMGCDNTTVWAMAEISYLADWKARQKSRGCLSMPTLVSEGLKIEKYLEPHFSLPSCSNVERQRQITADIFRASTRVYLHSVVSGDYPSCQEIIEGVDDTIECLKQVSLPTNERSVVRSVVFSIFICGCLTDDEEHRKYLLQRLKEQGKESVGNCSLVGQLMEEVWAVRRTSPKSHPVPWREKLQKKGLLLV